MARVHLQFWKHDAAATAPASAGLSAAAHALLISAWVMVTLPALNPRASEAEERVWYFPPPNTRPAQAGSVETLRYVALAPEGDGAGLGVAMDSPGVRLSDITPDGNYAGDAGRDSTSSPDQEAIAGSTDTVFTVIEVDTVASRLPESAAPRYPADLLEQRVQGQAIVQFVVDTTGRADQSSFVVIVSSHPRFAQSVREALPGMLFRPARIGALKVRQLVELPFTFNIAEPAPADSTAPRTVTRRRPE